MYFNDKNVCNYTIENQFDTLSDVKTIIERFYRLGEIADAKQIHIGDTNYSYELLITAENRSQKKYFAQLFNPDKSLENIKYELALRDYFMKNRKGMLKCATHISTVNGGYTVECYCPQISRTRYFCLFDFLEGKMAGDRDVWAFGRMSNELLDGITAGLAEFHVGAYGYKPPESCNLSDVGYLEELKMYRGIYVNGEEYLKNDENLKEYFQFFKEFKPRLLDLIDKYSSRYDNVKDELPRCICHMDPSVNNYLFGSKRKPISICDLDFSKEHLRLFDLCWLFLESFYNPDDLEDCMDISRCVYMLDAYDSAMEKLGSEKPGKLSEKEREMFPEIFQLVAIGFGFNNVWDIMLTGGPACSDEYNIYWGTWGKNSMEYMENHMDELKSMLLK